MLQITTMHELAYCESRKALRVTGSLPHLYVPKKSPSQTTFCHNRLSPRACLKLAAYDAQHNLRLAASATAGAKMRAKLSARHNNLATKKRNETENPDEYQNLL